MSKKAVVLVSGGLDSSTVLAMVEKQGFEIHALSFNYAQNHVIEIEKIKKFITNYNVKNHQIINLDLSAFSTSALVSKDVSVPKYNKSEDLGDDIPVTYVPARNTIFLSYALGYAEVIGAQDIFIGAHMTDSANYPDCRSEYLKSYENMANLATKSGVEGKQISITAPLIEMTKTEILTEGLKLGVDYSNTITCYDPTPKGESCGKCHACLVRLKAFEENNAKDPIVYVG
ncbi:MAG: 7-cyano-7-deazaguanine synthase QueC [Rickettsiaceae bacterium]|nr:7-cyano-7-deazaguanine synthase QueC [Rickettsiaceae bacterium]